MDRWERLSFWLQSPATAPRIEPLQNGCLLEIEDIVLRSGGDGRVLWRPLSEPELVEVGGTALRIPGPGFTLFSYGPNPQIILRETPRGDFPLRVDLSVRVTRDSERIAKALERWRVAGGADVATLTRENTVLAARNETLQRGSAELETLRRQHAELQARRAAFEQEVAELRASRAFKLSQQASGVFKRIKGLARG